MSELLEVLDAHEHEISLAFSENLEQAGCSSLFPPDGGAQTKAGSFGAILEATRSCCRPGEKASVRPWAMALHAEAASLGTSHGDVLAALSCFQRAVNFHLVKAVSQKGVLISALAELSRAVDRLRRRYVDTQLAEPREAGEAALDFAALADSVDLFVCMATLHGRPLYLNPAGRRLVGLDVAAAAASHGDAPALPTSLHDFYTHDSWVQLRDVAVPAVKESGHWQGQSQLRNAGTKALHDVLTKMLLVKRPHRDKPYCLAIIHSDAGDRIRLEESLAESLARKHAILESALDPIITVDHRGVITEFNRAAEQIFGHRRGDVLGTKPSEVLFPASKSAGHQNRIERYLDAGEGSLLGRRIEVTAVRAGGETFPAEMAMTISQEQGAPVLTFFVRDISQQKRAEKEQVRYAADLERSNRELEQFAYVTSHDLQEPLRKIRTFGDRLEMKCSEQLDETGRECVLRMQSAAARMQTLIEGLLILSQVTTRGKEFEPVDLTEVVREVVSDLEVQIEQAGGRVEVGKLPAIQGDAVQIRQLMQNLIGNALKFRRVDEPPVVKVHGRFVEGREQRRPGGSAADESCRILVEDNGIGFDEKYMERVFGIFQRLHPRDVYEGTGIGLAICRKIVERHRGSITARSELGKGTTFEVVLPVAHAERGKE